MNEINDDEDEDTTNSNNNENENNGMINDRKYRSNNW